MIYVIRGEPTPLARARHAHRRTYDSQKQLKSMMAIELQCQHCDRPLYSGPLRVEFTFFFGFPEKMSQEKKLKLVGKPHVFKPDLSNLVKLIEDIGTKILYHDDSYIASIAAYKCYDWYPRTEFVITEIK